MIVLGTIYLAVCAALIMVKPGKSFFEDMNTAWAIAMWPVSLVEAIFLAVTNPRELRQRWEDAKVRNLMDGD